MKASIFASIALALSRCIATNGRTGFATTTRYWDCKGGSCGCSYVPSGMPEDRPSHCQSNAMFEAPLGNEFDAKFYGAAAISASLGGGNWMASGCGKCWKLTGAGYYGNTSTIVVKGTNFCPDGNSKCAAGPHFDIAAPGFDVLKYSLEHDCPALEPENADGFAACSTWMIEDNDPEANCNCSLFVDPTLRAGCENFYSLRWTNPTVSYEEVSCPTELSRLYCSSSNYPATESNMPETCAANLFDEGHTFAPYKPTKKSCFSQANTVEVRGKGLISIDSLKIGDSVRVDENRFSRVYSFLHFEREIEAEYYQIHADGLDIPLEISPDHMVFAEGRNPVRASQIKVGDMLGESRVSEIKYVKRRGVYAPATESGDLIVSGVLTSSYAAVLPFAPINQHTGAHAFFAFRRLVCAFNFDICESETYSKDGIPDWLSSTVHFVRKTEERIFIQFVSSLVALPLIAAVYVTEQLVFSFSLFCVFAIGLFACKKTRVTNGKIVQCWDGLFQVLRTVAKLQYNT